MKSKSIPADVKLKSIKEAQNEIKEIIADLENKNVNLEESMDKYNKMLQLNNHINDQFKKKMREIRSPSLKKNKKT